MGYWKRILTPKNTEEIKPNLFVQKIKGDSLMARLDKSVKGHNKEIVPEKYRVIYPACWNNKYNLKVLFLGAYPIKSLLVFALILFLAWSYTNDIKQINDMAVELHTNQTFYYEFCKKMINTNNTEFYLNEICWNDNHGQFAINESDEYYPVYNFTIKVNG